MSSLPRSPAAILFGLVILATACSETDVQPIQEIGSVEVSLSDSCPAEATFLIEAGKGACDDPLPPIVEQRGHDIEVTLLVRTSEESWIAILESYEVAVSFDGHLDEGDHTVTVPSERNQKSASFRVEGCSRPDREE
jgi:hypothetical protein